MKIVRVELLENGSSITCGFCNVTWCFSVIFSGYYIGAVFDEKLNDILITWITNESKSFECYQFKERIRTITIPSCYVKWCHSPISLGIYIGAAFKKELNHTRMFWTNRSNSFRILQFLFSIKGWQRIIINKSMIWQIKVGKNSINYHWKLLYELVRFPNNSWHLFRRRYQ